MKTIYTVKKYNPVRNCFSYYNSFRTYKEAAEARDDLQRRYGGHFEIFEEPVED